MSRRRLFSSTALTPLMMLVGTGAAFAQAVAYPSATIGSFGGTWQGQALGSAEGRWTVPLGPTFGGQVDVLGGVAGGQTFSQIAGHAFWRDPSTALIGVYSAWTQQFGASTFRVGPEVEVYAGPFTFSGVSGWRTGTGISDFFAQAKGNLYLTPNTKIFGGYIYEGANFANAGFEHLFTNHGGLSVFGEVRTGSGVTAAWAGLRFYFGSGGIVKSLMDRDRQDVAPLWLHLTAQQQSSPSVSPSPSASGSPSSSPSPTPSPSGSP